MAGSDLPISGLPPAIPLDDSDLVALVQAGVTNKATVGQVADNILSRLSSEWVVANVSSIIQVFSERKLGDGAPSTILGLTPNHIIDLDFDISDGGTLLVKIDFGFYVVSGVAPAATQRVVFLTEFDSATSVNFFFPYSQTAGDQLYCTSQTVVIPTVFPGLHNFSVFANVGFAGDDVVYYGPVAVTIQLLTLNLNQSFVRTLEPLGESITTESGNDLATESGDDLFTEY